MMIDCIVVVYISILFIIVMMIGGYVYYFSDTHISVIQMWFIFGKLPEDYFF